MARDWQVTNALELLHARMARFGENIAEFPISMYQERRGAKVVWIVDLHIKVRRVTEFDISSEGDTLSDALRRAYLGLNNEGRCIDRAARANHVFGIAS